MNIIGLTGKKCSGKSTAAEALNTFINSQIKNQSCMRVAFADPLKKEIADTLNTTVSFIDKNKAIFRPLLQWWGTDYRRKLFNENYWILRANDKIDFLAKIGFTDIIVTDVRFLNEAEYIRQKGGVIWKIKRKKENEKEDTHVSELEVNQIEADIIIQNDVRLGQFKQNIIMLYKENYVWPRIERRKEPERTNITVTT